MQKVTVVLVEDEILIRKGIRAILEQEDIFEISHEFDNGADFVNFIESNEALPDIVLMDIKMPSLNGVEATKHLMSKYPSLKIIALSSYNTDVFIANMLEVGAVCYIPKSVSPTIMIQHIKSVLQNGFYYDQSVMKYVFNKTHKTKSFFDTDFLTDREKEVLNLICKQKSATEIGEILHISSRTVDGHRNNLLLKTESKNVVGLVVFAIQNNLFTLEVDF